MAAFDPFNYDVEVDTSKAKEAVDKLNESIDKLNEQLEKSEKDLAAEEQAVANLVNGINKANNVVEQFKSGFDRLHASTSGAFRESSSAMTSVNIVLGRTGMLNAKLASQQMANLRQLNGTVKGTTNTFQVHATNLAKDYELIESKVAKLAKTTQFSYVEIANMFAQLKQAGLTTNAIINPLQNAKASILEATLALSAASRGQLSLAESGRLLVLSANSVGGGLGEVANNASRMLRLINNADIGFKDLKISMEGLAGAGANLFPSSKPSEILGILGALTTAGRSPAFAAQDIVGMGRAMNNLISTIMVYEDKQLGSRSAFAKVNKVGDLKDRVGTRMSMKLFALEELGLLNQAHFLNFMSDRIDLGNLENFTSGRGQSRRLDPQKLKAAAPILADRNPGTQAGGYNFMPADDGLGGQRLLAVRKDVGGKQRPIRDIFNMITLAKAIKTADIARVGKLTGAMLDTQLTVNKIDGEQIETTFGQVMNLGLNQGVLKDAQSISGFKDVGDLLLRSRKNVDPNTGKTLGPDTGVLGPKQFEALLYKALGTQQAVNLLKGIQLYEDRLNEMDAGGNFNKFLDDLQDVADEKDAQAVFRAEATALQDLEGQTRLLEAAQFSLREGIGQVTGGFDLFVTKTAVNVVNGIDDVIRSSGGLNFAIGGMTTSIRGFATVGLALSGTLATLFSLAQIQRSSALLFGGDMKKAFAMIQPMIGILGKFAVVAGAATLVFFSLGEAFAFMSSGSGGSLLKGIADTLSELTRVFVDGIIPIIASGDAERHVQAIAQVTSHLTKGQGEFFRMIATALIDIKQFLGDVFTGFKFVFGFVGTVVITAFTAFAKILYIAVGFIISLVSHARRFIADITKNFVPQVDKMGLSLSYLNDEGSKNNIIMRGLAIIIGIVAGSYLLVATYTKAAAIITSVWTGVTEIATVVSAAYGGVLNFLTLSSNAFTISLKSGLVAGALFLVALYYLWEYGDRAGKVMAVIAVITAAASIAFYVFGGAGYFAGAPILLIVGAIGLLVTGLVLLIDYIGQATGWFNLFGESADNAGDSVASAKGKIGGDKKVSATSELEEGLAKLNAQAMPEMPTIPEDVSALTAPTQGMGSSIAKTSRVQMENYFTITANTNVDQLDPQVARSIGEQIAPFVIKELESIYDLGPTRVG